MKDMADYGLKKNAEGYADPTAYKAITGIQKPGEILAYKGGDALIIKNHGTFCSILRLKDKECGDNCTEIGGRYTDPRMLSYAVNDNFSTYQGKITPGEFGWVLAEIENALGIEIEPHTASAVSAVSASENVRLKEELDVMQARLKESELRAVDHVERCAVAEDEAMRCKIQLDLLKQMYSDLMEKFLQRA